MERRAYFPESLPNIEQAVLEWSAHRIGEWVDSILVKTEVSENPRTQELYQALWLPVMVKDLAICFSKISDRPPDKPRHFAEFAYQRLPSSVPDQVYPLHPMLLIHRPRVYVDTYVRFPSSEKFLVDQLPEFPRIALELACGFAAMHYIAVKKAEEQDTGYFQYGMVTMAGQPAVLAKYLGGLLEPSISPELALQAIGVDTAASPGLGDIIFFRQRLAQHPGNETRAEALIQIADYFIENPLAFIFARAKNMSSIIASPGVTPNTDKNQLSKLLIEKFERQLPR